MPQRNQHREIRSEEVQEILTHVPNWMILWGNTLLLILLLMILGISWLIKYPDIINTEVTITTSFPPEKIYARSSGQFDVLLAHEGDHVRKHQLLAVVENSASYKDVLLLKSVVDTIDMYRQDFSFPLDKLPPMLLGDIMTSYSQFENDYSDYILHKKLTPFAVEKTANSMSLLEAKGRLQIVLSQKELNKRELNFKKKDIQRSRTLFNKGVISAKEKEQKEIDLLQAERAYQSIQTSISQLREFIGTAEKNLEDTAIKKTQSDHTIRKKAIQSFLYLKKAITDWEKQYALQSSITGTVSFPSSWNTHQTIHTGDVVCSIIPEINTSYIGKVKAPPANSGKIQNGQKVLIQLTNYPADEFGELNGKVHAISQIPDEDGHYHIEVSLPKELKTTYGNHILFKPEMKGTAAIVTEDLRLIERFFYQIRNIIQ
ncbi:HlyD family efflux transporter periplasmic adaptor subunit [Aquimarina hainanensis]|uniref:HlyD family efflux transporter periplasmic adaptor subunit n=1 Tax=Aquimarina hainanensis TaxID=1578017 RepID=A0ABW5N6F9_9FLAO